MIAMAKLLGTPGKISMKFSSGNGIEKFEQDFYMTSAEAAEFLRGLAGEIEAGSSVELDYENVSISVDPSYPMKIEVECEKDEIEIELKLKQKH
jgi:amphi-Trp domain-containing protein